ncbi:hypothetical protein JCM10450v2_007191 [Rhodotorula kratochvilovae]
MVCFTLLLAATVALRPAAAQTLRGDGFALLYPTARDLADDTGRTEDTSVARVPLPLSGLAPLVLRAGENTSSGEVSATISWGANPTTFDLYEGRLQNGTETENALLEEVDAKGKGLYDCYETDVQNLLLDVESGNVTEGAVGTLIVYYDEGDETWTQCADIVLVSNYSAPAQFRECPGTSGAIRGGFGGGSGVLALLAAASAFLLA